MPQVSFVYSSVYDRRIREWQGLPFEGDEKKAREYVASFEESWRPLEDRVFDGLSKASRLDWRRDVIDCYFVGEVRPFSDPLTLPLDRDLLDAKEVLIHELAHNLLMQNRDRLRRVDYEQHGKISECTRVHMRVHAMIEPVLVDLFGRDVADLLIDNYSDMPEYAKAWEIVQKETFEKVLRDSIR